MGKMGLGFGRLRFLTFSCRRLCLFNKDMEVYNYQYEAYNKAKQEHT